MSTETGLKAGLANGPSVWDSWHSLRLYLSFWAINLLKELNEKVLRIETCATWKSLLKIQELEQPSNDECYCKNDSPTNGSLLQASSFESDLSSHHSHPGKSHESPMGSLRTRQTQQPPTPNWFCSKSDKPRPACCRVLRIRLFWFPVHNPSWGHETPALLHDLRPACLAS